MIKYLYIMINQIVKTHRRHFFCRPSVSAHIVSAYAYGQKKQNGRPLADTPVVFFLE